MKAEDKALASPSMRNPRYSSSAATPAAGGIGEGGRPMETAGIMAALAFNFAAPAYEGVDVVMHQQRRALFDPLDGPVPPGDGLQLEHDLLRESRPEDAGRITARDGVRRHIPRHHAACRD